MTFVERQQLSLVSEEELTDARQLSRKSIDQTSASHADSSGSRKQNLSTFSPSHVEHIRVSPLCDSFLLNLCIRSFFSFFCGVPLASLPPSA